jgi:hypothetical protein
VSTENHIWISSRKMCSCGYRPTMLKADDYMLQWKQHFDKEQRAQDAGRSESQLAFPELVARINNYLGSGGLWNPEHMEHDKVRQLLMDCDVALRCLMVTPAESTRQLERVKAQARLEEHTRTCYRCKKIEAGVDGWESSECERRVELEKESQSL